VGQAILPAAAFQAAFSRHASVFDPRSMERVGSAALALQFGFFRIQSKYANHDLLADSSSVRGRRRG